MFLPAGSVAETAPTVLKITRSPFIVQHRLVVVVWRKCAELLTRPIVSADSERRKSDLLRRFRRVVRDGRKYLDRTDQADELPLSFYVFWPSES